MRICWLLALVGCGRFGFGAIPVGDGAGAGDGAGDAVIDAAPLADVTISSLCPNAVALGNGSTPSIATEGGVYGVAFVDGLDVNFVPVSMLGNPGATTTLYTAAAPPANPTSTTITWDGSEYVVLYAMDGIYGATVASNGSIINANTTLDAVATAIQPSFATGGGNLRIQYTSTSTGYQQYTRTITSSPLAASSGTQLSNSAAGSGSYDPALAWTGTSWGAFWDDSKFSGGCYSHGIYQEQIKSNGMLGGGISTTYQTACDQSAPSERHHPSAVWNGSDVSVAFVGTPGDPAAIVVMRAVADTGALLSGPTVATSRGGTEATLAWTGSELGLAWVSGGVFLTRADASGNAASEVTIDDAGRSVAVVWDGAHYALVWERGGVIYFARTC